MQIRSIQLSLSLLLIVTPCLGALSASAQEAPKKILLIEADLWCPINCDPMAPKPGVAVELAKKAFEPLGYEVRYKIVPWTQALADTRAGKADMVVGANRSDDPSLIFPESSIYKMTDDFFVMKGNPWRYQGPYTLKGKRIGIVQGYGYGPVISQFIAENKSIMGMIQPATGTDAQQENINKLIAGKIDMIIEGKPVMDYMLRKLDFQDKVIWAGGIPQDAVYVAFSPAKPESRSRAQHYDAMISQLRASGGLDAIYGAYNMHP